MDSNGFSDPYVKFQSRFLDAGAQTAKVKKTLNPGTFCSFVVVVRARSEYM